MSQIMKSFLCVFLVLLMTVTSAEILAGFLQVLSAQDMHSRIISELENSHYNAQVLEACKTMASDHNYRLDVTLYEDAEVGGEVKLYFNYEAPFFGLKEEHVLSGYGM